MTCKNCRARQLVTIEVTVSGKNVAMHSCAGCSTRWWGDEQGGTIRLDEVLELAAVRR